MDDKEIALELTKIALSKMQPPWSKEDAKKTPAEIYNEIYGKIKGATSP